ncbi:MAG TPA: hypothetical protein DCE80_14940, partial [Ignavibacteriales bacterium]|nr:hypothetical protein [Ignavibacteriales bacterium]
MNKQFLLLVSLVVSLTTNCFTYDNEKVHPYVLTSKARNVLILNTGGTTSEQEKSSYYEVGKNFNDAPANLDQVPTGAAVLKGTKGTIEADNPDTITRYHFYNPITGAGGAGIFTGLANAIDYGSEFWDTAIQKWHEQKYEEAYFNLGKVVHLLQDMSSTAHVYNDSHIPPYIFFGETNAYEEWVTLNINKLRLGNNVIQPSGETYGAAGLSYDDFLRKVAEETFNSARVYGNLTKNPVVPATGELAQMFPENGISALAYMSYTEPNINNLYDEYWAIISDNDEYYYDYSLASNSWWPISNGVEYENYQNDLINITINTQFYFEQPRKIIPAKVWANGWVNNPNNYTLAHLWAGVNGYKATPNQEEELVPLAINYTAGLMKWYYDNFKPYLKKAQIYQNNNLKYEAEWKWNDTKQILELIPEEVRQPGSIKAGKDIYVKLEFAKPMKEVAATLDTIHPAVNLTAVSDTDDKIWEGTIPIESDISGPQDLQVTGKDKTEPAGLALDGDPATIAYRDPNDSTQWLDQNSGKTPGYDCNHKIIVERSNITSWKYQLDMNLQYLYSETVPYQAFGIEFTGSHLYSGNAESKLPEQSACFKAFSINAQFLPIENISQTINFDVMGAGGGRWIMWKNGPAEGNLVGGMPNDNVFLRT